MNWTINKSIKTKRMEKTSLEWILFFIEELQLLLRNPKSIKHR